MERGSTVEPGLPHSTCIIEQDTAKLPLLIEKVLPIDALYVWMCVWMTVKRKVQYKYRPVTIHHSVLIRWPLRGALDQRMFCHVTLSQWNLNTGSDSLSVTDVYCNIKVFVHEYYLHLFLNGAILLWTFPVVDTSVGPEPRLETTGSYLLPRSLIRVINQPNTDCHYNVHVFVIKDVPVSASLTSW